jgi:hypothetical protein
MRNDYEHEYIIICEPVRDKFRRLMLERKINKAAEKGYKTVGSPTFYRNNKVTYGVVLMVKQFNL